MTKREAFDFITEEKLVHSMNSKNTVFSNINNRKRVWWVNVPLSKFDSDLYLILNDIDELIILKIKGRSISGYKTKFKIRKDFADIEISAQKKEKYLKDIKSGGIGFDFRPFLLHTITKM